MTAPGWRPSSPAGAAAQTVCISRLAYHCGLGAAMVCLARITHVIAAVALLIVLQGHMLARGRHQAPITHDRHCRSGPWMHTPSTCWTCSECTHNCQLYRAALQEGLPAAKLVARLARQRQERPGAPGRCCRSHQSRPQSWGPSGPAGSWSALVASPLARCSVSGP